jgi:tetrahydromethanopterin S-methyltransferase subunit G
MASQSDAVLFQELKERLDKLEERVAGLVDEVQRLASKQNEQDLMPVVYPDKPAAPPSAKGNKGSF